MRSRRGGIAAILLAVSVPAGCARTHLESSVVDAFGADDQAMDFWQQLEGHRMVSTNDALHGLFLVADGTDTADSYPLRLAEARRRGWVRGADPAANDSASVGLVALAACNILEIKGGVTMHLLGPSARYCTRELVFLEILPPRTEHQALSGLEFIDVLGQLEDRLGERQLTGRREE